MYPHVVYLPALKKYVMILSVNHWKEYVHKTGLRKSGVRTVGRSAAVSAPTAPPVMNITRRAWSGARRSSSR